MHKNERTFCVYAQRVLCAIFRHGFSVPEIASRTSCKTAVRILLPKKCGL